MVSGTILVPAPMHETEIQVLIADTTQAPDNTLPVLCTIPKWQLDDSPAFCYRAYNGKIPRTETVLTDWVAVTNIPTETLNFPRKGKLTLKFVTSLISQQTGDELACAETLLEYENQKLGYIDVRENARRTETLTLQLAMSASAVTEQLDHASNEIIAEWVDLRVGFKTQQNSDDPAALRSEFENALQDITTIKEIQIDRICTELMSIATIVDIYDAMDLCLRVIAAGNTANPCQTEFVSRVAHLLDVDETKFREMTQKRLPLAMHQQHDLEFILGITADMSPEHRRKRLNDEYQKWNARVNHPDKAIQSQADQMLTLIAEARNKFDQTATVSAASN
jgi:hypothetical protein